MGHYDCQLEVCNKFRKLLQILEIARQKLINKINTSEHKQLNMPLVIAMPLESIQNLLYFLLTTCGCIIETLPR